MLSLSRSSGIGGRIKEKPEDFVVKEITKKGHILEPGRRYSASELDEEEAESGKFTTFVLQKRDWNTLQALIRIAKTLGHGRKSVGYSGLKDRRSISTQLASVFGATPEQVVGITLKDVSINGAWRSNGVEMGSNLGNSFEVTVRNPDHADAVDDVIDELDGRMPNYFDRQRFGMRQNNHKVGMLLMRGDFEAAVMEFLTNADNETNSGSIEARSRLSEDPDFQKALEYFPRHLNTERSVLASLAKYNNYANAIRAIPRGISLLFIHAVEAYIFNAALEKRIKDSDFSSSIFCGKNFYGFPDMDALQGSGEFPIAAIVGYNTKDEYLSEYEKDVMDQMEIAKESFKIKQMPELSMKGTFRTMLAPVKDLGCKSAEGSMALNFSIPPGSYATILLNELMKNQDRKAVD